MIEVLNAINVLIENNMIYILLLLMCKFVFLEKLPDNKKYKWYYIVTFSVVSVFSFILSVTPQILAIVFTGVAVSIGRSERKKRGFFVAFPAIGIINGLVVPILILPTIVCDMSLLGTILYRIGIHLVLYVAVICFFTIGKRWREKFAIESDKRRLRRWEFALLGVVSILATSYSALIQGLPNAGFEGSAETVIYVKICLVAVTLLSFLLTILIIILILQGNKRNYYNMKALANHEIAEKRRESVERLSIQMINALANTIDAKDSYTNGHSTRVAKYSVMIAKKMGYDKEQINLVEYTALLHDIGKIGVPREIINKPSRLTDDEYEIIKTHPAIGSKTLEGITEIPDIAIGARYHHERFDGRGYPDGLTGTDIPEIARIIGVADAYDAMTSNRSYRELLSQEIVRGEIEKGKGTQFDPDIADVMLSIIDEDTEYNFHE